MFYSKCQNARNERPRITAEHNYKHDIRTHANTQSSQDLYKTCMDEYRQQLVLERTGFSRESAAQFTPASIKGLRPPVDGCYLVWQLAQECFQAYYPIPLAQRKPEGRKTKRSKKSRSSVPTHWSRTRKYGQVRSKTRSQQTALTMVVHFLWKCFADHGEGDSISNPCRALRQHTHIC